MDVLQIIPQLLLDSVWIVWVRVDSLVIGIDHSLFAGQQTSTGRRRQTPVIHFTINFIFIDADLIVGVVVINQLYRTWRPRQNQIFQGKFKFPVLMRIQFQHFGEIFLQDRPTDSFNR